MERKSQSFIGRLGSSVQKLFKAQLSDFVEDGQIWCKEFEANAKKVVEHKRKYERRRETKGGS
jgi:hypothetical protein